MRNLYIDRRLKLSAKLDKIGFEKVIFVIAMRFLVIDKEDTAEAGEEAGPAAEGEEEKPAAEDDKPAEDAAE